MFPNLPNSLYDIVYCDPPWDYKGQKQHTGKGGKDSGGATSHYPTVTLQDLKNLDVPSICAQDCLIYMWVTSPHLDQGIDLMKHWGFQYATIVFIWHKQSTNPGFYTLSECEICLVGKRGKIPQPRGSRKERQFYSEKRGAHSAKPTEFRDRIHKMFPHHKKIELFSRWGGDEKWDTWGNQAE